jgi:hypothetical protein
MRRATWWITAVVLALLSLLWVDATVTWVGVLASSRGGGLLYSAVDIPMLLIPVIAWRARTRRLDGPSPDQGAARRLDPTDHNHPVSA